MFNPCPKTQVFRSRKYLKWLIKNHQLVGGYGDIVYHHLKCFKNGGTGIKPPDNDAIPIPDSTHKSIHQYGEMRILGEVYGFTIQQLRQKCDGYYNEWLKTV